MTHAEEQERKDNEKYTVNFTRTPNIVFHSCKYLSKEEKHLYTVLRYVYWDTKPRYVTLRELHELTDFSIGALSKMLPRLHICGLIHAEIRRERVKGGREKGNPKYHITILDIWELNKYYFSCSPDEQELMDPSLKLVHETAQACSPNGTGSFTKRDKPVREKKQGRAQPELAKKDVKTSLKKPIKTEEENAANRDVVTDATVSLPLPDKSLNQPLMPEIPETPMPVESIVPLIPFNELPWGAEKALATTEGIVGVTYISRDKELMACAELLSTYHSPEGIYVRVVKKILPWYEGKGRLLKPTDLTAITKRGVVRYAELLEDIQYEDKHRTPVPTGDEEYHVHTAPLVNTDEELPTRYVDAMTALARERGGLDYLSESLRSVLLVYRDASPEWFKETFTHYLAEANGLTRDQVRAKRREDHLDYLCKAIQIQFKQSQLPVVESN